MEKLKKGRTPLRSQMTKLVKECTDLLVAPVPDLNLLSTNLELLEQINEAMEELNNQIVAKMLDVDVTTEKDLDSEYESAQKYKKDFISTKRGIEKLIVAASRPGSPAPSIISSASQDGAVKRNYKLPKIELKKFGGELKDWLGFWSQFRKIHEDETLDPSDKFHYLLQAMGEGRQRDVVESYPQTAENYPKAVKALQERFGKSDLLVEVYVRELLKLVITNANYSKDQQNLSLLYDQLESHLRALESLGVTSDKYNAILFPMVESCLPRFILRAWQRNKKDVTIDQGSKLKNLMEFLLAEVESEQRINLACEGFGLKNEAPPTSQPRKSSGSNKTRKSEDSFPATAAGLVNGSADNRSDRKCVFCDRNHNSTDCFKAQGMGLDEKKSLLKKRHCCFQCFRTGHRISVCKTPVRCVICRGKHQNLLCPNLPVEKDEKSEKSDCEEQEGPSTFASCSSHCVTKQQVILQTIMVKLKNGEKEKSVRALFDTGSQRSHILRSTAEEMGFQPTGSETITHILFGGVEAKDVFHKKYKIFLEKNDGSFLCNFDVLDQDRICGKLPSVHPGKWMQDMKKQGVWLEDVNNQDAPIEILIGGDVYGKLHTGKICQLKSGLTAVGTRLGWTVMGKFPCANVQSTTSSSMIVTSLMMNEMSVPDLWRLETIGIQDPIELKSNDEKNAAVMEQFQKTVIQQPDGRYEVNLPWSSGCQAIPDNRAVAEKRLQSTTRKLNANHMCQEYHNIFNEWCKEGIIELVGADQMNRKSHYLPHRPVIKEDSLTTKVRPVFDASCKTGRAPSLNECLEKGPNLIDLIPSIMLRFREERVGVISDIRKAFLMIGIRLEDRDFLRFLWWESPECKRMIVYRHKRVVFGVNSSPFLLAAVIEHHLSKYREEKRAIARKLHSSLYVDNCVASLSSEVELDHFKKASIAMMAEAQMDLRMWQSNVDVSSNSEDRIVSVLGMKWDRYEDVLYCDYQIPAQHPQVMTKRSILSTIQKIFDPLGILAPVTVCSKLMFQETWAQKKGWDDELEEETKVKFIKWMDQLHLIPLIKVPRWFAKGNQDRGKWSLHTFCDASGYAYAAATFLRCEGENGTAVQLLQAKARVAPLKATSINRLELLACDIGSRLSASVCKALSLEDLNKYYWTDSSSALAWIKRNDEWGTFVGNRVRSILKSSDPGNWKHVPGILNPADLPSRGCNAAQLYESRWWEGPEWLSKPPREWPGKEPIFDEAVVDLERKKKIIVGVNAVDSCSQRPWYMIRSSSYRKIVIQMAYVLRFIEVLKKKPPTFTNEMSVEEIQNAEKVLIKLVQKEAFPPDMKMKTLTIEKDVDGIMRVKTKITMREDTYDFRYPVLLPSKHPLVEALIREEHLKSCHAGTQYLISKLRERFWIIQTRKTVNSIIHNCVKCRRFAAKNAETNAAPLPFDRVRDAASFEIVGVDLAGPLYLKDKRKAWIVLYTCAVYRAIHLELVTSLDTESFLQSFRRFVARRGRPRIVFSDNGTNFRGSVNLFRSVDWEEIRRKFLVEPIIWRFSPPSASWWGGFWERLVRSVKGLLVRVLGKSSVLYEELMTILCDVEAIINNRPLTYVNEDGQDLVPLTPAMFIQGAPADGVPEVDVIDERGFQSRYRYRQILQQELRKRFRKEYLGILLQRTKDDKRNQISIGDVVFIGNDQKKRLDWQLGKVVELVPGKDGIVRVAKVKTNTGEMLRPIQRLYPTEVSGKDPILEEDKLNQDLAEPRVSRFGRKLKPPTRLGLD